MACARVPKTHAFAEHLPLCHNIGHNLVQLTNGPGHGRRYDPVFLYIVLKHRVPTFKNSKLHGAHSARNTNNSTGP